ncbi:MAG: hypothetical protein PV344_07900 [Anaplasma sp.]|nr:hypothetical protein [Anaplasma sp.]
MIDRVMTSQPHDLAREFQTTHKAHVKRDVTRGISRSPHISNDFTL